MMRVPTAIVDRHGDLWIYQYGRMYGSETGRVLRRMESILRLSDGGSEF